MFHKKHLGGEMNMNYKNAPYSKFHTGLYLCIILGQIACGYALGIAGTAVTQAQAELGFSTFWVGLLGAGTLIGLSGSLFIGNIADRIGRHKFLFWDMALFSVISVLQLFTSNIGVLMVLRVCLGLCIAVEYAVGSTIVSEWFPPKKAPKFLSYFIIFWTFGYVASFFAGLVMSKVAVDYHIIFATSVVPGAVTAVLRFVLGIPESPSWLASVGRHEEADALVAKKLGAEYRVEAEKKEVVEKVSLTELFGPKYRNNTIAGGVFYACQVFPYFGVGIFLPILVSQLNMGNADASSILYDVVSMVGACFGCWLCNRLSRRQFLISTFFVAAAALAVMIFGHSSIVVTVIAFAVYALTMSAAVVMEWPYPPELFDDRVRGTGVGIIIAFSRVGAALGTFLLPILVEQIGVYGALGVCFAILLLGGVVCALMAPETSPKFVKKNAETAEEAA